MTELVGLNAGLADRALGDPTLANVVYNDWVASAYDPRWKVSYHDAAVAYARATFTRAAGAHQQSFARSLEIGCGTGSFTLNLHRAGVIRDSVACDISPGMAALAGRNARSLGVRLKVDVCDVRRLPYRDDEFDLVFSHEVLRHVPQFDEAISECMRVLKPGGKLVICREPISRSRWGKIVRRGIPTLSSEGTRTATHIQVGGSTADSATQKYGQLAAIADVNEFAPDELKRIVIRAGAIDVRVVRDAAAADAIVWATEHLAGNGWLGPLRRPAQSVAEAGRAAMADMERRFGLGALTDTVAGSFSLSAVKA